MSASASTLSRPTSSALSEQLAAYRAALASGARPVNPTASEPDEPGTVEWMAAVAVELPRS